MPSATAVVNGDSFGWKKRMYGSSDVSVNRSVISASISGVSASRPEPDTDRRGDAASISIVSSSPRSDRRPLHLADAFVAGEEIVDAAAARRSAAIRTCRCRWR